MNEYTADVRTEFDLGLLCSPVLINKISQNISINLFDLLSNADRSK